jgi:hypothetical protein
MLHARRSGPQEGAQRRTGSFAGVAVDLPYTIAIVIAGPLVLSVIDRGMRQLQAVVTAVLIRIDDRRVGRNGFAQNALAGDFVAVADQRAALFTRLAADDMNDRRLVAVNY